MTLRTNCLDIQFPQEDTGVATTVRFDFAALTLIIPEAPSRTFRSVEMEVTCRGTEISATSLTAWLLGIKLGAVAFNDVTTTSTIGNTGEQQTFIFTRDVTAYFVSNFGTLNEQTCQIGVTPTGPGINNITARLRITYEYDDTEVKDTGTATAGAAATLTDSGKAWTTDDKKHWFVKITGGTGSGQVRKIASNTATVLTVTPNWTTNPDTSSVYQILLGRVKTVAIPLDGYAGTLTTSLVEIGTNQVPNLSTYCPEADITFLNVCFEVTTNEVSSAATDYELQLALDAEGADSDGLHESALISGNWYRRLWVRNDMTTTAVHAFKAASSVGTQHNLLSAVLFVTYLYNHADSTTILNSLTLIMPKQSDGWFGGTASGDAQRYEMTFYVEEPATIALLQSGVQIHFVDHNIITGINVRVGGQTYRAYTHASGSVNAGAHVLGQRFDSGGLQGSGLTLVRGKNTLVVDVYRTTTGSGAFGSPQGLRVFLNYSSGKHASGVGVHAHTTHWAYEDFGTETGGPVWQALSASKAPIIPESDFFNVNQGIYAQIMHGNAACAVSIDAEVKSGEGAGDGWLCCASADQISDAELSVYLVYDSFPPVWQRWSSDPDTSRMVIETARVMRASLSNVGRIGWGMYLTYHSIPFTVAGTLAGYSGDGSGITVDIHKDDTDEKLVAATTAAGGGYTATWFDNTENVYAQARQDSTHLGRSDAGAAS